MGRKLFVAVLVALAVAPAASARPTQLMPGVTYDRILRWTPAGPVVLHLVTAPKPQGLYKLTPLLSNGTITGRERVSSMQRAASAQMTTVGVNGDFFSWTGGWPSGLLMRAGVVEHQSALGRAAVGIDTAATLHADKVPWFGRWHGPDNVWYPVAQLNEPPRANAVSLFTPAWGARTPAAKGLTVVLQPFPPAAPRQDLVGTIAAFGAGESTDIPADGAVLVARGTAAAPLRALPVGTPVTLRIPLPTTWSSVTDAVSAGPTLVRNGKPIFNAGEALTSAQLRGRDPRTAIGQRADGSILMLAVDGRRRGWSIGMTNWEMAQTLVKYGAVTGFALDSGGSTTVAFDGKVLNRPSDVGGERAVGEALVIGYTGVYAPPVAATLSPNADGVGDVESLSYRLVRPATVSAKLIGPDGSTRELDTGARAPGRYKLSWDGVDAPEGRYHWNVTATDDLGQASTDDHAFTLDNTLGFLQVGKNARQIGFTLTRDATVRVTLETRAGGILRTVARGLRAAGTVTVSWNGRDGRGKRVRRGTYVVRAAATSTLGLTQLAARVALR
ncbi:MAG: phosphodiester glycosidase family protein [Gaiellaceae bacterium]